MLQFCQLLELWFLIYVWGSFPENALLCESFAIQPNHDPASWQQSIILLKILDVLKSWVGHLSQDMKIMINFVLERGKIAILLIKLEEGSFQICSSFVLTLFCLILKSNIFLRAHTSAELVYLAQHPGCALCFLFSSPSISIWNLAPHTSPYGPPAPHPPLQQLPLGIKSTLVCAALCFFVHKLQWPSVLTMLGCQSDWNHPKFKF